MPVLIVEDLPGEIYERIQRQAQAKLRTISEEAVRLLEQGLSAQDTASAESAPSPASVAEARPADPPYRLPSPFILDTGEISPPCSLPRSSPGVEVPTQSGGERQPTSFTFVEEAEASDV